MLTCCGHDCSAGTRARLAERTTSPVEVVQTGNTPQLRHVERAHRVDIRWVHEQSARRRYDLVRVDTTDKVADICAKPFREKANWQHAGRSVQGTRPAELFKHYRFVGDRAGDQPPGGAFRKFRT